MKHTLLATLLVAVMTMAGCGGLFGGDAPTFDGPLSAYGFKVPADASPTKALNASQLEWPDFSGATLRIIDHGAFGSFATVSKRFTELTGATVERVEADDTGAMVTKLIQNKASPRHDIAYGIDNMLLWKAVDDGIIQPYTPQLAPRVASQYVFFQGAEEWPATPVDHGYIALNVDHLAERLDGVPISSLHDLRVHADAFVTEDPRQSTPGLGFFLLTVGRFGETGSYTWKHYWTELMRGADGNHSTGDEMKVVSSWSTAYEKHFSGGYGVFEAGHIGEHPIVTSYTTSPAYEWYWDFVYPNATGGKKGAHYDNDTANLPRVLLDSQGSVFEQIQTMAIVKGTKNRAIAEAWIEFTLTDDFQRLAAPDNAIYPVVKSVSVRPVFQGLDPDPATLPVVPMQWDHIGPNLKRWLQEWTELCERLKCI
jgi:thiamine transport system substrate-binding protein